MDYIIYTSEGQTFFPNSEESKNCQILDFDYDTNHTEEDVIADYLYDNPTDETGLDPEKIQFAYAIEKETIDSIWNVVKYLWHDEKKHFEESDSPADHIFHDLETLANYLDKDYRELGTFED